MNLWIDDEKPAPHGWAVARTYDDAVRLLRTCEYDEVAFDHDLGDTHTPERTGYDLLCAIERGELLKPKRARVITWNSAGRVRMLMALAKIYGLGAG